MIVYSYKRNFQYTKHVSWFYTGYMVFPRVYNLMALRRSSVQECFASGSGLMINSSLR